MKRRKFLSAASIATGGLFLSSGLSFPYQHDFKTTDFDDEVLWQEVRKRFLLPDNLTYLNTAGNGALPQSVLSNVSKVMEYDAMHPGPGVKGEKWEKVKQKCAMLLSDNIDISEIALISSATEGCNIVINGLPLKKGDEVIVSTHEHPAVLVPLINRMNNDGIVLKIFKPDLSDTSNIIKDINALINKRTKLIFISHVAFATGTIFPVSEVGQIAADNNIWFAVDGAQAAGNIPINIENDNIDFYTYSGHKWLLGPKRTGVLYVKKDMLNICKAVNVGGGSYDNYDVTKGELVLHNSAERYEYGTINNALYYGLADAIDFLDQITLQKIWDHNKNLAESFFEGLKNIAGIIIKSPSEKNHRSSIISFEIPGLDCIDVYRHLILEKKIRVRPVFENGMNFIRASFHIYNNEEDVDKLLYEIKNIKL